jgi:LEA14-like dessication related protein
MIKFAPEVMVEELNTMIQQRLKNHIKNINSSTIRAELYEQLKTFRYDYEFDDTPEL